MSSRAEQKEKRRQEILEAALDQFIRRGYAATKIKDITEAAGMSFVPSIRLILPPSRCSLLKCLY